MAEISVTEDASARRHERTEAWMKLRHAVVEEYVGKLPELLDIDEFARLAGMTIRQVRHAASSGALVISIRSGRRGIAPADNIPFLLRTRLLRLHAAKPVREHTGPRSLPVSEAAYERVWDEAVRTSLPPAEALEQLILASSGSAPVTSSKRLPSAPSA
jgi:hypothetical protein